MAEGAANGRARAHPLWGLFSSSADRAVRIRLFAAIGAAVVGAALLVAAPVVLKWLIDALESGGAADGAGAMGELVGLYVCALALGRVCDQAQAYWFGTGEQRLQQRLSAAMFEHVLHLPMKVHLDRKTGGVVQTLTLGLQGARIVLTHGAFTILPLLVQTALILLVLVEIFDWVLWASVVGAMAAYAAVFSLGVRRLAGPTRAVSATQVDAGGLFADGLMNVEPVKAFTAEGLIGERYTALLQEGERRWRVFHARRFENGLAASLVFAALLAIALTQGAWALNGGRITIGDFVLLNTYILQLVRPLELAGFAVRDVAQGLHYLERWDELLRIDREAPAAAGGVRPSGSSAAPAIRFEGVSFSYDGAAQALSGVDIVAPSGRIVAVVGASGAGKSTLLRLLMRYYEPSEGRILLDEEPIDQMDLDVLRGMIGVVAQDTVLFNQSLEDNILLADPRADGAALSEVIARARLQELVDRLPLGLKTIVGERGLKLSGGERQRIAIARALLKDAPVLVLDEATSALDANTEREIAAQLRTASAGRTTLIVTHRLALAEAADEVVVLEGGRVVERGAPSDLACAGGHYARLCARQMDDNPSELGDSG